MGRDKVFNRLNVGRWMRAHGYGGQLELADQAQLVFGVDGMLVGFEPGDHWLWDVAAGVVAEREGNHAFAA